MALITSDLIPPRDRAAFMGDLVSRQLMDMHARQVGDGLVRGRLRAEMIAELPVAEIGGANLRASRTRAHIARSPLPFYFANIQIAGASSLRTREQDIALSVGDIYIVDTLYEFELNVERPHRHLAMRIPKPWLDALVARPDLIPGTVLRHDHPLSRLFASYVLNGLEMAAELSAEAAPLVRHPFGRAPRPGARRETVGRATTVGGIASSAVRSCLPHPCAAVCRTGSGAEGDCARIGRIHAVAPEDLCRTRRDGDGAGFGGARKPGGEASGLVGGGPSHHHRDRIRLWFQRQRAFHPRLRRTFELDAIAMAAAGL